MMKNVFTSLLFVIVCSAYSQTYTNEIGNLPDPNVPARTLQDIRNEELNYNINEVRDKNYDKALDVVAPIDGTGNDNSGQETVSSLSMKEANKVKLVDYSNVRPSDVYTSNEDGTRTAKGDSYNTTTGEVYNSKNNFYNGHSNQGMMYAIFLFFEAVICFFIASYYGKKKHIGKLWSFLLLFPTIIPGVIAISSSPPCDKKPTKGNWGHLGFGIFFLFACFINLSRFHQSRYLETDIPIIFSIWTIFIIGLYLINLKRGVVKNETIQSSNNEDKKDTKKQKNINDLLINKDSLSKLKDLKNQGIISDSEYEEKELKIKKIAIEKEILESVDYRNLKDLLNNGILNQIEFDEKLVLLKEKNVL